jgi:hypothetical protein
MQSAYTSYSSNATPPSLTGARIDSMRQRLWQLGCAIAECFTPEDPIQVRQGRRKGQTIWFVYDRYRGMAPIRVKMGHIS